MNGEECKALRVRLNLTQQEFADKLGVCRSLIVRGERVMPSLLLRRLISGWTCQEEVARLTARLKEKETLIRLLKGGSKNGAHALAEENIRLKAENADLTRTIKVMLSVRKSGKAKLA